MRRARFDRADRGFATYEMILLVLALSVFLAGVVPVVNDGVRGFQQEGSGSTALEEEGERVLDDLEVLVRDARVVYPLLETSNVSTPGGRLGFAADLDGTGGDLRLSEGGEFAVVDGLQIVDVYRGSPRKLEASVVDSDSGNDVVTICGSLDPLSRTAFSYQLLASGGQKIVSDRDYRAGQMVSSIKVAVRLRIDGESKQYSRVIKLLKPAPLAPIKQD